MTASQIISEAVAATIKKAQESGMINSDEEMQAAGRAAISLVMTSFPDLYAAYAEEVSDSILVAA